MSDAILSSAERSLLGSLIRDPRWIPFVAEQLPAGDFFNPSLGEVYSLLLRLDAAGEEISASTVPLHAHRQLPAWVTLSPSEIVELSDIPSAAGARAYLDHVRESARRRRAATALREGLAALEDPTTTATAIGEQLAETIRTATEDRKLSGGWRTIGEAARKVLERADAIERGDLKAGGILLGLKPLDDILDGLHPGDLCVIGARPGMGKSALAAQIAEFVASQPDSAVGYLSLEMPDQQLAGRHIGARARVGISRLRNGELSRQERERAGAAVEEIARLPILVDDEAGLTFGRVLSKIRKLWTFRPDLKLVVLDYIQLCEGDDPRAGREAQVSAGSRALKALAKELGIAILALAQLNRGLETRSNRRPIQSDLRESGGIEQDSDSIVFIYREEVYAPDDPKVAGKAELIVAKNRHGPTGTAHLRWVGYHTRFEALIPETPPDPGGLFPPKGDPAEGMPY